MSRSKSAQLQDVYEEEEFKELLEKARMNAANDWEESFVADMRARYDQYGKRMFISDSQQRNLERIADDNR